MGYDISFLVAIQQSGGTLEIHHFEKEQDALLFVEKVDRNLVDISDKICGDDECQEEECHCDKSIFLLNPRLAHCEYQCDDPQCDCEILRQYGNIPVNIDRTIRKAYKNKESIVCIYYQIVEMVHSSLR